MFPKRFKPNLYSGLFSKKMLFNPIKGRARELGLDMQLLWRLLETGYDWPPDPMEVSSIYLPTINTFFQFLGYSMLQGTPIALETIILDMVERHYVESDPLMRTWLKYFHARFAPKPARGHWKKNMVEHLRGFHTNTEVQQRYSLYSGDHHLPVNVPVDIRFAIDPCIVGIARVDASVLHGRAQNKFYYSAPSVKSRVIVCTMEGVHRGRRKRSSSAPEPCEWGTARFRGPRPVLHCDHRNIFFPKRRVALLDKLSRRRSLSRTHIRAMFADKPKWHRHEPRNKKDRNETKHPCANCAERTHKTSDCLSFCGYCRSPAHMASNCPVKVSNRCKCMPFPQYHLAADCPVRCSRRCGCPEHPGHFKHKNAMLCNYRCCMCGTKGHSGKKCSLKKCPCGEQHLTQDCRWKVECPAKGCNYYLCRLHCRECGKRKEKGSKDQFVGRTCQDCLRNGRPVTRSLGES